MSHYASDESCADFSLIMHQSAFGSQAPPSAQTCRESLQRSPDLLAGFKGWGRDKGRGNREKTGGKGIAEGDRRRREGMGEGRGTEERGEKGKGG